MPWKLPWWLVVRARMAARSASSVRPGNVVQPLPIASDAWASLLPTLARSWSVANRTTRSCQYRPSAVGLNVSIASGRTAASRSSSRRRSRSAWAHSGYGTRGWAGIAMPPCSWTAAMDQRRLRRAGTGRSRNRPSRWPPRVLTSSPTITRVRSPRSSAMRRAARAASIRSWSVIAMTSSTPSRSTRSRISVTGAVPSEASVWMWRSARPSRSVGSPRPSLGRHPAAPVSRSGQIGWKAPHHCSGASASSVSSVAATAAVWAIIRSRRVPPSGSGTRTTRHR